MAILLWPNIDKTLPGIPESWGFTKNKAVAATQVETSTVHIV